MAAFIGKLGKRMDSFKTTRKLMQRQGSGVRAPGAGDLTEQELSLRDRLSWQATMTEAVAYYSHSVVEAFQLLEAAHRGLLEAGVSDVTGIGTARLEAVVHGCAEGWRMVADQAAVLRRPLAQRRDRVTACREKVKAFDLAWSECKHYEEKMGVLKQEYEDALRKGRQSGCEKYAATTESQAVDRNKAKLKEAEQGVKEARRDAKRSLLEVNQSHDELVGIVRDAVMSSATALRQLDAPSARLMEAVLAPSAPLPAASSAGCGAEVLGEAPSAPAVSPSRSARMSNEADSDEESQPPLDRALTPGFAKSLLNSPMLLASLCAKYFRRYDTNRDGMLELSEAVALVDDLQEELGVPFVDRPDETQVKQLLDRHSGPVHPSSLSADQFTDWFAFALQATLDKSAAAAR